MDQDMARVTSRREMIRLLDGYSLDRKEELDERRVKRPFVKSYLLEVRERAPDGSPSRLEDVFARRGIPLRPLEDGLFLAETRTGETIGFLEALRPRIAVIYSLMDAKPLEGLVRNLVGRERVPDVTGPPGRTVSGRPCC